MLIVSDTASASASRFNSATERFRESGLFETLRASTCTRVLAALFADSPPKPNSLILTTTESPARDEEESAANKKRKIAIRRYIDLSILLDSYRRGVCVCMSNRSGFCEAGVACTSAATSGSHQI